MNGEELRKYESVRKWIDSLKQSAVSRGKQFSQMAERTRLGRLMEFTNDGEINPDDIIQEARGNIDKAGERMKAYFDSKLKEGIDWNSATTNLSFLRGFYSHNDIVFPKRYKLPKRKVSEVSKTDSKTEIYTYDEKTNGTVFHNGTLKHFFDNLGFRDQTIGLCLLSTGADSADILDLKIGFVKDAKGQISTTKRFAFNGNRLKDGVEFKTFFSAEATEYLRRYVEQERPNAKDDDLIFVKEDGSKIPTHALAMNFRKAAEKMGYVVDEVSNPFRPKRFRHLFRTACGIANIDAGYVMAMMGHASNISGSYLEKSNGLLLREFLRVEPYLTVYGIDKSQIGEINEKVAEVKTSLADLALEKDSLKKRLDATEKELKDKKAEVENLKSYIQNLKLENDESHNKAEERMNYFSTKIDEFETYIRSVRKRRKRRG